MHVNRNILAKVKQVCMLSLSIITNSQFFCMEADSVSNNESQRGARILLQAAMRFPIWLIFLAYCCK